ncbi:MAG: RecX family transcriptional regulator [Bacteroidota bacterium]
MSIAQAHPAYPKAARYCSYQDRTEKEVRVKLHALGVTQETAVEELMQALRAEKFLDEERYVASFIRGRIVGKQWGRRKIQRALASKGVAEMLIRQGLAAIDEAAYLQGLRTVAERKKQVLADKDPRQQKLTNYLLQKGYEPDLVYQIVQELAAS